MAAPTNLSFETPSGTPVGGGAASWALHSTVGALRWALFGTTRGYESFDRGWSANESFVSSFTVDQLEAAEFASVGGEPLFYEGFDRQWSGNENYEFDFAGLETLPAESFDDWVVGYLTNLEGDGILSAPADFDGAAFEDFETWGSYFTTFGGTSWDGEVMGTQTASWSDLAGYPTESFVDVRPGGVGQADPSTNRIYVAGHAFLANDRMRLDGLPPPPLAAGVWYFVVSPTAGLDFQVALTSGGAAVDLTGVGGGFTAAGDPVPFWLQVMRTI